MDEHHVHEGAELASIRKPLRKDQNFNLARICALPAQKEQLDRIVLQQQAQITPKQLNRLFVIMICVIPLVILSLIVWFAQKNLGVCYYNGNGVTKDLAEAVKWYRKAAEQGYADAQFNLGVCYYIGNGVTKDLSEAAKWFRKAAEQGYADAQFNLGVCYYNGNGVTKDLAEAVKWYRKAAEQGKADAQVCLGWCYENGKGVEKDLKEAVKWYRVAAEQGNEDAKQLLQRLQSLGY